MRGNPLWQLALIVAAFALMGLPVWRLTRPAQARISGLAGSGVEAPAPASTATATPVVLEVAAEFAPAAEEFSVSYLGDPILQGKAQAKASGRWKVVLPAEGADLVLHTAWPAAEGEDRTGVRAARVRVRWPDGREVEKSFWPEDGGASDTVMTVPGDGK